VTIAAAPAAERPEASAAAPRREPRSLALRYMLWLLALVGFLLTLTSALNAWLSYRQASEAAARLQDDKADAAAQRIAEFIAEIERQIGWTTHVQWDLGSVDQRRLDYIRLLRQVPAISELVQLDREGKEQLKVSRLSVDVIGSGQDYAADPRFTEALQSRVRFSPVYFRKESEPFLSLSVARGGRQPGVTIAEVNLKLIWDVINTIRIGETGYAYAVDGKGRLLAHPDISQVLRNSDLSALPQVRAALGGIGRRPGAEDGAVVAGRDLQDRAVYAAYAAIPRLNWAVLVEQPAREALAPLYAALFRNLSLLVAGLGLAALSAWALARRMVVPIRELSASAAKLGSGDLAHRVEPRQGSGAEIEALAESFNAMGERLQESYADLEAKVAARTMELSESLSFQTATSAILSVISRSPSDVRPVLEAIVETAAGLCEGFDATLLLRDGDVLRVGAHFGTIPLDFTEKEISRAWITGRSVVDRRSVHVDDFALERAEFPEGYELHRRHGHRTGLAIPLLREGEAIGAFMIRRMEVAPFTDKQIAVLQTFADQAVIAIENARLFEEVQARTRELARSVGELRALSEVGRAVSSTLDLKEVLETIVTRAVGLAGAEAGAIYRFRRSTGAFWLAGMAGSDHFHDEIDESMFGERSAMGRAIASREAAQVDDMAQLPPQPLRDRSLAAGFRAVLVTPLVFGERLHGLLVLQRRAVGAFEPSVVEATQAFATQSAIAIQNARLFREIEEKGRQLEIASQHKSQFLANMSHELRTPLNAILGYAELMADGIYGGLPEKPREVLARIQANGKHLLGLINDVLDLSKIEAGQFTLRKEPYAMRTLIDATLAATEPLAKAKGLSLEADVAEGLPAGVGDTQRLSQVLLNLAGNAIKFTEKGGVTLSCRFEAGRFRIDVADTGPGIAAADQAAIFEEFKQVDNTSTRNKGGTGLGLAISRRIARLHGGDITLRSRPGEGSVFTLAVPAEPATQEEAA
jgi:signal transduction histidine kinase/HAMP domain-containing protein